MPKLKVEIRGMFYTQTYRNRMIMFTLWLIATFNALPNCNSKSLLNRTYDFIVPRDASTETPTTSTSASEQPSRDIIIGPCTWAIGRECPDTDIKFYLYTRKNMMDRQFLHVDVTLEKSNLTASFFNPKHPTKIIIHGYNSDMFLHPLQLLRDEYFAIGEYNLVYVDWSVLSPGPCYISAVHNTKHAGACVAQLVERIVDYGSTDMHVIGFSLGAQLANYIATNLRSFLLPRITGLDPALPLFITAADTDKLDTSDAAYVDVIHTNALVQGKLERCGHADFYMNGGIMHPGCSKFGTNPFACSHQRAPAYFLESVRTKRGFWGWACSSYISYLLGMCPPTNYLVEAGERIKPTTRGMFLINTNDTSPYALGKWTELPMLGAKQQQPTLVLRQPEQSGDPLLRHIDQWGKLDAPFNNIQEPRIEYWTYVNDDNNDDDKKPQTLLTNDLKDDVSVEEQELEDKGNGKDGVAKNHGHVVEWSEYRRNLTAGFIENSIFQVPHIG